MNLLHLYMLYVLSCFVHPIKHHEALSKKVTMIPAEIFSYKQELFIDHHPAVNIYKVHREKFELMHAVIVKLLKMSMEPIKSDQQRI